MEDYFSKSMMVESNSIKPRFKKNKKIFINEEYKDSKLLKCELQNIKNLEKSSDLFTSETNKMKYEFSEIIKEIDEEVQAVNFKNVKPYYLPNNFTRWRNKQYRKME